MGHGLTVQLFAPAHHLRVFGVAVMLQGPLGPLTATALALDRLFPPDLSRYRERSTEIVDANDRLLRAFTTSDGKWRLRTTVDDVDPTYLAMLKAYEDRRFDVHWGIDPFAVFRAAEQWIGRGRIVSGASTLSMQVARLVEPRRERSLEAFRKELAGHQTTKELLKVRYDEPLPEDLIRRIAEHRLRVVKAREDDSFW